MFRSLFVVTCGRYLSALAYLTRSADNLERVVTCGRYLSALAHLTRSAENSERVRLVVGEPVIRGLNPTGCCFLMRHTASEPVGSPKKINIIYITLFWTPLYFFSWDVAQTNMSVLRFIFYPAENRYARNRETDKIVLNSMVVNLAILFYPIHARSNCKPDSFFVLKNYQFNRILRNKSI